MIQTTFNKLTQDEQLLLQKAKGTAHQASVQYSNTHVGAALLTDTNKIIPGASLESAPFDSVCAERSALLTANVLGEGWVEMMAVYVRKMHDEHKSPSVLCAKYRTKVVHHQKRYNKLVKIISVCPDMKTVYKFRVEEIMA